MGALSFLGPFFLGTGPLVVVFLACIARKSFLVLLGLARWAVCGLGVRAAGQARRLLRPSGRAAAPGQRGRAH